MPCNLDLGLHWIAMRDVRGCPGNATIQLTNQQGRRNNIEAVMALTLGPSGLSKAHFAFIPLLLPFWMLLWDSERVGGCSKVALEIPRNCYGLATNLLPTCYELATKKNGLLRGGVSVISYVPISRSPSPCPRSRWEPTPA